MGEEDLGPDLDTLNLLGGVWEAGVSENPERPPREAASAGYLAGLSHSRVGARRLRGWTAGQPRAQSAKRKAQSSAVWVTEFES